VWTEVAGSLSQMYDRMHSASPPCATNHC
jgi:hypothetical protein